LLVERLEDRLSDRALRCVPLCNATLALMLGIRALAGRPRAGADEVLLPSFTFAAPVNDGRNLGSWRRPKPEQFDHSVVASFRRFLSR
jgi:dTDP-4-amino-4,6-dideoxygalactose transaminase